MFLKLVLLIALGVVLQQQIVEAADEKKIVCYQGTWATYRQGNGKYDVENIDPFLCTHYVYSFFGIQENGSVRITDPYLDLEDDGGRGNIKKFNEIKLKNPKIKTIAAAGGWNEGSEKFSIVANDPALRKVFVDEVVALLLKFGFDGFDLDWEYPNKRHTLPNDDKTNFVLLLKELKEAFIPHGFTLSVAVSAAQDSVVISYNVPEVYKHCDYVHIMAYDLYGPWDTVTGYNAALYAGPQDVSPTQKQLNIKAIIDYWLSQGAIPSKTILGVPFYGHTFTLVNASDHGVASPSSGPGIAGPYSQEAGTIAYNELCEKMMTEKWNAVWDKVQQVPYAYSDKTWVSYDNIQSITIKAQYAASRNLGGVMAWSLESDDFRGLCGPKYPLLNAINKGLGITPQQKNVFEKVKDFFRNIFNKN